MNLPQQIAQHLRDFYFGGNWTASNLKEKLTDVSWQQATTPIDSFHTIATLVFHMNYFVAAVLQVLRGGPLDAKDKFSFDVPLIQSQEDWQAFLETVWTNAEEVASLIEQLPEATLWETFADDKYGNTYRNLQGIIEHNHYHLGQIAMLKKLLAARHAD